MHAIGRTRGRYCRAEWHAHRRTSFEKIRSRQALLDIFDWTQRDRALPRRANASALIAEHMPITLLQGTSEPEVFHAALASLNMKLSLKNQMRASRKWVLKMRPYVTPNLYAQ
jgi:hypothetical protein